MKKLLLLFSAFCFILGGCGEVVVDIDKSNNGFAITDVFGNVTYLKDNARIVSAYGSFSECVLLAGGELVGVTNDAVSERNLDLDENTEIIGTVKDINLEKIISLAPDYLILSADITAQLAFEENLKMLEIPYGYFRVDSFDDYDSFMKQFCGYTQRDDLYEEHVISIRENIQNILDKVPENANKTFLLMRVYSTGIKVKNDNIADSMLKELGAVSITDKCPSLLQDLSVEKVIVENPDYIFVSTMGDENTAVEYFTNNIVNNPAWSGLSEIKSGNCTVLPKELFHYKPNNRWDESYEYLARILYPEIFDAENEKE